MASADHLAILERGVEVWNKWRRSSPPHCGVDRDYIHPDLSGAGLFGAPLNGIDLRGADLRKSDLRNAQLVGVDFRGCRIEGTRLAGANLFAAHFGPIAMYVRHDDISFYLPVAGEAAGLSGPNVTDARFGFTTIDSIDLRSWEGLESVRHQGPSTITVKTLVKSHGQFPPDFLSGCGFPNELIEGLPSILNNAIQFQSCFISYSTNDEDFAKRLVADLKNKGVRCWFSAHDARSGQKLYQQIETAIRTYDRLLVILSDHSMNSEWVKTEINLARRREIDENRIVLFPISLVPFERIQKWQCFDADIGKDSAREIREYLIPIAHYTHWTNDSYRRACQKLVNDLRVVETPGSPS